MKSRLQPVVPLVALFVAAVATIASAFDSSGNPTPIPAACYGKCSGTTITCGYGLSPCCCFIGGKDTCVCRTVTDCTQANGCQP